MSPAFLTMIKILTYFLLGCVVSTFGKSGQIGQGRVVETRERYSFLMYVKVCFSDATCNICTGTLVTTKVVLVAAHCFCSDKSLKKIHVYARAPKREKWLHRIGKRVPKKSPTYECLPTTTIPKSQVGNDIAIITIKRPFPNIVPVEMVCGAVPKEGQRIKVIGYGLKNRKKEDSEIRISKGKTVACPRSVMRVQALCTIGRENLIDNQLGDSGGPLLMKRGRKSLLMGVAYHKVTNDGKTLEAWTNVAPHCGWIKSGLNEARSIADGRKVKNPQRFPFMMYVIICGRNEACYSCTGALVRKDAVLMAAHCFCKFYSAGSLQLSRITVMPLDNKARSIEGHLAMINLKPYDCDETNKLQVGSDLAFIALNKPFANIEPVPLLCKKRYKQRRFKVLGYGYRNQTRTVELRISKGRTLKCPESPKVTDKTFCTMGRDLLFGTDMQDTGSVMIKKSKGKFVLMGIWHMEKKYPGYNDPLDVWISVAPHCHWINQAYPAGLR